MGRTFVGKVTLGNPHFIKETLEQLIENQFISVILGTNGQAKNIENMKDLNTVNLSSWGSTRMVGGTKNLLESLDPLEAAVLKMSTCFLGSFTLPDLAASTCSRWAEPHISIYCVSSKPFASSSRRALSRWSRRQMMILARDSSA